MPTEPSLHTRVVTVGDWQGSGIDVDETVEEVHERWCDAAQRFRDCSIPVPIRLHREGKRILVNPQMIEMVYDYERSMF